MFICGSRRLKASCEFLSHRPRKAIIWRKSKPLNSGVIGVLRFISGINEWDKEFQLDIVKKIENHWKMRLTEKKFDEKNHKDKLYILSMFPYPSGRLHMGHVRVYGTSDVLARYFRMKGKNVLHPMGWDAFGLPAENAAFERRINPEEWTQKNIADMKAVMEDLNFSFDWDREFATCDSEYYKWTQFFFIKLYEMGLIYRQKAVVNWDPVDQTVLADEQVDIQGRSWRSGALVEKKLLEQWFVKTTAFAKSLLEGLNDPVLKGWKDVIDIQKNWIGEVNGTTIDFEIVDGDNISENYGKKMSIWLKHPEHIDKAKFVAVKTDSFWAFGSEAKSLMTYKVRNPFTNELLPVYKTDSVSFPEGKEVYIGIPELSEVDREFADSVSLQYSLQKQNLANEEELLKLRENICAEARRREIGGHPTSSNLKDWLISRQRYWGTPIPIVYCQKCGDQPVPEENLPIRLPVMNLNAKEKNPLVKQRDWVNTLCPKCGGEATRETDTMDTFVDSSWYYLRFIDPDNQQGAFSVKKIKSFTPVDIYVGGKEHAALHLFYARFMNHFLHSLGVVPHREPFARFLSQGVVKALTYKSKKTGEFVSKELVLKKDGGFFHKKTNEELIEDWEKMSKSKNNVVEPTTLIAKYGSDLTRMVILGASSPQSDINWDENLCNDIFRWQRRVWLTVANFIKLRSLNSVKPVETKKFKELDFYIYDSRNYYLKKIVFFMENHHDLGTALRKIQGLTNSLRKCTDEVVTHSLQFERALAVHIILLAPFAPFFASELWAGFTKASNKLCDTGEILWDKSVFQQPWPKVDSNYPSFGNKSIEATYDDSIEKNSILKEIKQKSIKGKKEKMTKKGC